MTLELDGFLWKPKPGTAVTAEEFIRSRSVMQEIHRAVEWNPWVQEDRAEEYTAALEAIAQWTRAEPGSLPQSAEELRSEIDRQVAADRARRDAEREKAKQERAEQAASYDRQRAEARLALLGQTAIVADTTRQRDQVASRELYPAMEDERRQEKLAKLDVDIKAASHMVDELTLAVGDVEAVCDERGWLPSERRVLMLQVFAACRVSEVLELRGRVAAHQSDLKAIRGSGRARIREALLRDTARLTFLEAVPRLEAADMCSECPTPADWHSLTVTFSLDPSKDVGAVGGPCSAWPWWRDRLEAARQRILARASPKAKPPEAAVPMPIAVIEPGLPIEEVIARLNAVQADHPGAQLRGSGDRWEIWPRDHA
ncbi:hypothetical protein EAS64_38535 [Trebonia kvetii]|uniref:Uncharacterized protein n=1 Tax=Trebonia kvetii TaxID=2480626 RepID=A0A6P2BM16_9ACTN|nr:hypothetical protein [Trebonia kvetii]TVY99989.1 hypothetical protein EAS64_38535 [Trebonia kvetii]